MIDKLDQYQEASAEIPTSNTLWPLYGAGLENMGENGNPIQVPLLEIGPDELLVRNDACGLCFSDTKVIAQGEQHPRIQRDMKAQPVVLGHEVCMTIISVGKNLQDQYKAGDRITLQPDIYNDGVGMAYGYAIQGGLAQYGVIDKRVLNSDHGNYVIRLDPKLGYAESALAEPWACVVAAYRLEYRTMFKSGGTTWIIGTGEERPYTISAGFDENSHPERLMLTNIPTEFRKFLVSRAEEIGIEIIEVSNITSPPIQTVDDIVLLGADPDILESVSPYLATFGIFAVIADKQFSRKVSMDVGRIHYQRWLYVGCTGIDVSEAYSSTPVRSTTKPGGRILFAGAGGPIGRMHVQRALELPEPPSVIVVTDVNDLRLSELCDSFSGDAQKRNIRFICLNPMNSSQYQASMAEFIEENFDDIIVTAPVGPVVAEVSTYLAPNGVMNVFAGLAPGSMVDLEISDAYLKNTRIIGHSASGLGDMVSTIEQTLNGNLSTNRAVAAIGSLGAALNGIKAVQESVYPGKIVIYPQLKELPLTALPDLKSFLPTVYEKLENGRVWTNEAEKELFRVLLP